ncbi:MAG: two-component regulator propeller domain-containing protein, partial [Bacteroidota bacterium]|nr:two-component regulator propeller domain-containing protein [Bacteroidota bacterium]
YNNLNSSLQTQLPDQPTEPYVRVGGMDFDSKGNLWVTNSGVANVISVFQTDGQWKSFDLRGIANNRFIGKVLVTKDDVKWVILGRGEYMYALNRDNNQSKMQKVTAYFTNSKEELYTEMSDVNAIAEDQNGELWLGTSSGVAVFSNPQKIWEDATLFATRPGLDLNDGIFHPLLEKESITAIAIDGANRKWIGTKTSGVFLISENGDTELEHFNKENSPLPTNEITDIAINQKSGEVFIGTTVGLISYMGEATAGNEEFVDVYVYPNPVRETYDGPIVVKGLVEDTDLRITDISGNLVHKTTSLGGQAVWDGRNLNGNRCKTGVYLVFMSDASGNKTMVTKLLFIH